MKLSFFILVTVISLSCASSRSNENKPNQPSVTPALENEKSRVSGTIYDERDEPMIGAKVMLIQNGMMIHGVLTNVDGQFVIQNVLPGLYDIEINYLGYEPILDTQIEIKESTNIEYGMIKTGEPQIISLKPIIYLYPEKEMDISVELNYNGNLTHTYPKYPEQGWKVHASPNGALFDEQGQEYYALFWEGKPNQPIDPKNGFVVSGEETTRFLEEKLAELGLNRREANEFIMYWLPQLEINPYNLIHFSSEAYQELAELTVTPQPETFIRIMMIYKPLQMKIDFPVQDISSLKNERKGFTLVEWGGMAWPTSAF